MCQHVYIASDAELPAVPWREESPAFHTFTLDQAERRVAKHFSKRHILYLGASTGRSCGFRGPSKDVSAQQVERNVESLVAYVSAAAGQSALELFTSWDGDELSKPDERLALRPEELRQTGEWFREGVFVAIARNA